VKDPNNQYLQISAEPAWDLLFKLKEIHPRLAHYRFRAACGLEACPRSDKFRSWVKSNKGSFKSILDFTNKRIGEIDLSIGSADLSNNSNFLDSNSFQKRIQRVLEDKNLDLAIGGYEEYRPFYESDAFIRESNNGLEWRTLHLGLDVWTKESCNVFSPLDSEVYGIHNNEGYCNYGPTLILRHKIAPEFEFYTLYGHLKLESLKHLKKGMHISGGDKIAELGSPEENGSWPIHLHFQIILDLLDNKTDFPGVAFPSESDCWLSISPDPSDFFLYPTKTIRPRPIEDILADRKNSLGKSLSVSYEKPLHIVRAYNQYLYDIQGRRYLDTVNNVPHVGHQHPRVVKAEQDQTAILNTNTRYLNENILKYTKDLLSYFPKELSVVHFVNSGSEANELALRMAEAYTGSEEMVAVQHAYHGNTKACIAVSSYKFDGKGGKGVPDNTHVLSIPDLYRNVPDTKKELEQIFENIEKKKSGPASFICESLLSCGGQIILPDGFLSSVYQAIRSQGGICIADEVQVGFGRVGEKFWAFELQAVIPDIVTLGKPMGNGHPLGAVVCTQKIANAFSNGMEYFNTFGGNPVSCAIGNEVLRIIEEEDLQTNAIKTGSYLLDELKKLQAQFPLIGDVRGKGLFIGIELVKDRKSKLPANKEASYLVNRMRERGILMSIDGPYENVLKIKPPLCFNTQNADLLIKNLELILKERYMKQ
jgi:4-aminobutyrate aminotransferase-like enzyme